MEDDYDLIPPHIQQEIHDFAKIKFVPALLQNLKAHGLPMDGVTFSNFYRIAEGPYLPKPFFTDEQRYDIWKLEHLQRMPVNYY
jgi:hypothetical protein